ncbi:uncharacterized protein LOC134278404 [Saccostrea cucullata]|uniref:uncharacterized protein LOC134278404 n=1 Tax=Saccostrea cuccullata TaxID=36930 RepID=UPI002ED31716
MEIGNSISVCICSLGVLFLWFSIDILTVSGDDILVKTNTSSGFQFSVYDSRILPKEQTFGNLTGISNTVNLWNDEYVYLKEKKIYRGTLTKNSSISATLIFDFGKITRISVDSFQKNVYFYEETLKMIGVTPVNSSPGDLIYRVIVSQIEKLESFAVESFHRYDISLFLDKYLYVSTFMSLGCESRTDPLKTLGGFY